MKVWIPSWSSLQTEQGRQNLCTNNQSSNRKETSDQRSTQVKNILEVQWEKCLKEAMWEGSSRRWHLSRTRRIELEGWKWVMSLRGTCAFRSYIRIFIPFYLLRKNTYFTSQVSFYLKSCDHFSFIKNFFFSPVKISLQYVAAQLSFILRTMAFLPPVLCEGLWVVGDEKRAPSCHSPTKPLKMMTASISTQCHILKVIFLRRGLQKAAASQKCSCFSWCGRCRLCADAATSINTSLPLNY